MSTYVYQALLIWGILRSIMQPLSWYNWETGMPHTGRAVRAGWVRGKHRVLWKHGSEPPKELAGDEGE